MSELRIEDCRRDHGENRYGTEDEPGYRSTPGLNPSSVAAGMMGFHHGIMELDVTAIRDAYEGQRPPPSTTQQQKMDRGTLAHLALLQPELLAERVAVWHGGRRQGAEWDGFKDENAGKLLVSFDDYKETLRKTNQLRNLPQVANWISGLQFEVSLHWTEGVFGLPLRCKGRVDGIDFQNRVIIDPKFTEVGIDARSCRNNIRAMRYAVKMAMYRRGAATITGASVEDWRVYLIFFGMGSRYGVRRMKLASDTLELADMHRKQAVEATAKAIDDNAWPVFVADDVMGLENWELPNDEGEVEIDYE